MAFLTLMHIGYANDNGLSISDVLTNALNREDSLFADSTKNERYIYQGKSPNNYIIFDKALWRILAFESDGTIKIIKNDNIGSLAFNISGSNSWQNASLNKYLNEHYYHNLPDLVRENISLHSWNTGDIYKNDKSTSLADVKNEEEQRSYQGYIGLMSMSDYIGANDNTRKCGSLDNLFKNADLCYQTNYINDIISKDKNGMAWTISGDASSDNLVFYAGKYYFADGYSNYDVAVYPVLYLKSNIQLLGNGSKSHPYIIRE